MGNCLFNKLKGSISSDLPIYNSIRVRFRSGEYSEANRCILTTLTSIESSQPVDISSAAPFSTFDIIGVTSKTFDTPKYCLVRFPNTNGNCVIKGKYSFDYLQVPGTGNNNMGLNATGVMSYKVTGEDLSFATNLILFKMSTCIEGTLNLQGTTHLSEFRTSADDNTEENNYTFNIEELKENNLTSIFAKRNANMYGSVNVALPLSTNLTALRLWLTSCTGDLKTLMDTLSFNGKTSGNILIECSNGLIEYDGEPLTIAKVKELDPGSDGYLFNIEFDPSYGTNGWRVKQS